MLQSLIICHGKSVLFILNIINRKLNTATALYKNLFEAGWKGFAITLKFRFCNSYILLVTFDWIHWFILIGKGIIEQSIIVFPPKFAPLQTVLIHYTVFESINACIQNNQLVICRRYNKIPMPTRCFRKDSILIYFDSLTILYCKNI